MPRDGCVPGSGEASLNSWMRDVREPIGIYSVLQNGQLEVMGHQQPQGEVKRIHPDRRVHPGGDIEKLASEAWKGLM